jgi:hypothetical protein
MGRAAGMARGKLTSLEEFLRREGVELEVSHDGPRMH